MKYYIAWILADCVNNASGLGFNGYDANGKAKWDLVTNIDLIGLEVRETKPAYCQDLRLQSTLLSLSSYRQVSRHLSTNGTFRLNSGFVESLTIVCQPERPWASLFSVHSGTDSTLDTISHLFYLLS